MKRFLNGQSIVLFGPTSKDIYGYDENINIKGNGCSSWCEWFTDDWHKKCLRGFEDAPCMTSIKPKTVLEASEKIIKNIHEYSYKCIESYNYENEIEKFIISNITDKNAVIVDVFNKNYLNLSLNLSKHFRKVTVFRQDYQHDTFLFAKQNGLTAEYGCLYNIAMPNDSCDVVIWQNEDKNLQHLYYILKELFRIVKPGKYLIISGVTIAADIATQFELELKQSSVYVFSKEITK